MKKLIFSICVAVGSILFPFLAWAQVEPLRDPLNYSLRQYGFILGVSLLGGIVAWFRRVKKGEAKMSISEMIGELTASAFAGLVVFWLCEEWGMSPLITAAACGISGHAGSSALAWIERLGKKHIARQFGFGPSEKAPLQKED